MGAGQIASLGRYGKNPELFQGRGRSFATDCRLWSFLEQRPEIRSRLFGDDGDYVCVRIARPLVLRRFQYLNAGESRFDKFCQKRLF